MILKSLYDSVEQYMLIFEMFKSLVSLSLSLSIYLKNILNRIYVLRLDFRSSLCQYNFEISIDSVEQYMRYENL